MLAVCLQWPNFSYKAFPYSPLTLDALISYCLSLAVIAYIPVLYWMTFINVWLHIYLFSLYNAVYLL